MRKFRRRGLGGEEGVRLAPVAVAAGLLLAAGAVLAAPGIGELSAQEGTHPGKEPYDRWCAGCHGVEGDGQGPAAEWMLPRPRDFTQGIYQIRTTASGQLPTDEDILRVIDEGMPGTTMPGWEGVLSQDVRDDLVDYLKTFSPFFESSPAPEPLDFESAPGADAERIAEGREVYERVECYRCHGDEGRGEGRSAPTLEDDEGLPVRAADLTANWRFNGGGSVEEIYRRMRTGLDGTPMPSQSDLIDGGVITAEELWSLAHYVRSLSPERSPPRVRDVIEAELVEEGPLPTTVDDEAWEAAESFYIPLVGQIIVEQRWFEPRVHSVWVEALHDGSELALRVSWNDPSESPDPEWAEWQGRVLETLQPAAGQGVEPGPSADRLSVQFPQEMPEGNRRPYFLMGDNRDPVYLWTWESTGSGPTEEEARGMTSISELPQEGQSLVGDAAWEAGQWQVLFRRSIEAPEDGTRLSFPIGEAVPIAFFAWDGDNGEDGTRSAVSSWYFIHLSDETPATVYVTPVAAMALTALLGVGVVARAQKRERESRRGAGGGSGTGNGGHAPGEGRRRPEEDGAEDVEEPEEEEGGD